MGTRGIYTFAEGRTQHHVYSHWDNYPSGAAGKLKATIESGKVWFLPRFEADEFAAGFIAANKEEGGNYRLSKTRHSACDVEYGYKIWVDKKTNQLKVKVTSTDFWDKPKETQLFEGPIEEFYTWAEGYE